MGDDFDTLPFPAQCDRAAKAAVGGITNSYAARLAWGAVTALAAKMYEREWSSSAASVSAAPSASAPPLAAVQPPEPVGGASGAQVVADVRSVATASEMLEPPAPGHHDAAKYPEFNFQKIPEDLQASFTLDQSEASEITEEYESTDEAVIHLPPYGGVREHGASVSAASSASAPPLASVAEEVVRDKPSVYTIPKHESWSPPSSDAGAYDDIDYGGDVAGNDMHEKDEEEDGGGACNITEEEEGGGTKKPEGGAVDPGATADIRNCIDRACGSLLTADHFGWCEALGSPPAGRGGGTGLDKEKLQDIVPCLRWLLQDDSVEPLVEKTLRLAWSTWPDPKPDYERTLCNVRNLRMQHRNLLHRRDSILKDMFEVVRTQRKHQVHQGSSARLVGPVVAQRIIDGVDNDETRDVIEGYMRELRDAFVSTDQQTRYRNDDMANEQLKNWQASRRQDTRFNSMLLEAYGGRHCIRTFLTTGYLRDVKVGPAGGRVIRQQVPKAARRPVAEYVRYFAKMYRDMHNNEKRRSRVYNHFKKQVDKHRKEMEDPRAVLHDFTAPEADANLKRAARFLNDCCRAGRVST